MNLHHADEPQEILKVSRPRSSKLDKPYCCKFTNCPSGFKAKRDLLRHEKLKHKPLQVVDCNKN